MNILVFLFHYLYQMSLLSKFILYRKKSSYEMSTSVSDVQNDRFFDSGFPK